MRKVFKHSLRDDAKQSRSEKKMSGRLDGFALNKVRGKSRVRICHTQLEREGWKVSKKGKSFNYVSPSGKTFWSSKEVERFISNSDATTAGTTEEERPSERKRKGASDSDDSDYEPNSDEEFGTTDDCLSSPEKVIPSIVSKR